MNGVVYSVTRRLKRAIRFECNLSPHLVYRELCRLPHPEDVHPLRPEPPARRLGHAVAVLLVPSPLGRAAVSPLDALFSLENLT